MSSAPANLKGLEDLLSRRYSLSVTNGHIVVNDVWYLDEAGALAKGRLAAPLTLVETDQVGAPVNHQMFWSGTAPHYTDHSPIPLGAAAVENIMIGGTPYPHQFSNKPEEGFATYMLLIETYVALISSPAEHKFGVTARTGAIYDIPEEDSPFKIEDTFSARAQIGVLNDLLKDDRIAIIGLGGTGAFVLDFMVKTPVHSIDAYDFDIFQVHNGFRSPGEVPFEMFGETKTTFYRRKYDDFRHRLLFHQKRVGAGDEALFQDTTFAFICIDDGEARAEICTMLSALGIPFIDVGMGIEKENGCLDGLIRTTLFSKETNHLAINEVPRDNVDDEGAYQVFVQIAELNALSATLAVIRYKQFRKFYTDDTNYYNSLFVIGLTKIFGMS